MHYSSRSSFGRKYQRGASKLGMLVLFILIAGLLTVGLRVTPLYVDNNLIVGLCQEILDNGEAANMTQTEVRDRVSNTLRINGITNFDLTSIRLDKSDERPEITVSYEQRVPLVANLEIIAVFDSTLR